MTRRDFHESGKFLSLSRPPPPSQGNIFFPANVRQRIRYRREVSKRGKSWLARTILLPLETYLPLLSPLLPLEVLPPTDKGIVLHDCRSFSRESFARGAIVRAYDARGVCKSHRVVGEKQKAEHPSVREDVTLSL